MTIQIAIIDPYVNMPALNCFNGLVNNLQLGATYHAPSQLGIQSLIDNSARTSAYVVLGSASHVHENLPWHKPLANFLLSQLSKNKPVLGCCFGHQLICHAFGADVVFYNPDESKLAGSREVRVTQDVWNFEKDERFYLGVTHRQVVKNLPNHLKAIGFGLENDIVIHETLPFLGTQAHPEASNHFCQNDIANLNESEILKVRKDGKDLIARFFQHFKLI